MIEKEIQIEQKAGFKADDTLVINELYWSPGKGEPCILQQINCVLEKGNMYGIIGPNGSGKTSFIKTLLRFVEATKGTILLDGKNIKSYKSRSYAKKMALVPQNTNMDSEFSVHDIVMMGRIPYQKRFADNSLEDERMVEEAMRRTDCYDFKDKEVSLLSGGEAQRVATARAIAQNTPWLLLDEPTASLDVKHQVELMSFLRDLKNKNEKTVIAVLHDINMASRYCNKIIMMKDGKIHSQGNTKEVLTKENLAQVYEIQFDVLEDASTGESYFIPLG